LFEESLTQQHRNSDEPVAATGAQAGLRDTGRFVRAGLNPSTIPVASSLGSCLPSSRRQTGGARSFGP
jgi:hypothetical protein